MFDIRPCNIEICGNNSLKDRDVCLLHSSEKDEIEKEYIDILKNRTDISDINFSFMDLSGLDLKGKQFVKCCFSESIFKSTDLSSSQFNMCFFDNAQWEDCKLLEVYIMNTVFACSRIKGCNFTGSDIITCNFNGTIISNTNFNESDLYYSRFINSRMSEVNFIDCNLKRVDFSGFSEEKVSFKYSNTEEAYFQY